MVLIKKYQKISVDLGCLNVLPFPVADGLRWRPVSLFHILLSWWCSTQSMNECVFFPPWEHIIASSYLLQTQVDDLYGPFQPKPLGGSRKVL